MAEGSLAEDIICPSVMPRAGRRRYQGRDCGRGRTRYQDIKATSEEVDALSQWADMSKAGQA